MKLKKIADLVNGRIVGDPDIDISGVSDLKTANQGEISFLADKKSLRSVYNTNASALIAKEVVKDLTINMIIVDNPHLAFAKTLGIFYKKSFKAIGISKNAEIGSDVTFGENVSIYPLVFIGNNVSIGNRAVIFPHTYIGNNVSIGDDSLVYPNVTIRDDVIIGNNVIIHSGTVIGSDGFGYAREKERLYKVPQVGGVLVEDDVEIGANVTIDRATIDKTVIGRGTKIDNLVQIAHNVKIGKNCIIISQVALGGSVEISDEVILAGQAAVREHVKIGRGVMVGGQSGIGHDVPDGQMVSGTPAIPHKTWMRAQSIYSKLPDYIKRLHKLERKINRGD
jgi:UDP-3-O-[3-hydroxymyristoyl] glucosamine N-acyltransferase